MGSLRPRWAVILSLGLLAAPALTSCGGYGATTTTSVTVDTILPTTTTSALESTATTGDDAGTGSGGGGSGSALVFSPTQLPEGQTGQAYQVDIVVSGNYTPVETIVIATGSLPPGLTLTRPGNRDSASISGTPQEAGRFEFTVRASCLGTNVSGQTGQQVYTLTVE